MQVTRNERGATARRIYSVLHRNPGLTAVEIESKLPDLSIAAVNCALNKMKKRGTVEVRGKKPTHHPGKRPSQASVYHVKYKTGVTYAPKRKVEAPKVEAPKVEAPKVEAPKVEAPKVEAPKVEAPKVAKPDQTAALLADALLEVTQTNRLMAKLLSDTITQLLQTQDELEAAQQRKGVWAAIKGWFA